MGASREEAPAINPHPTNPRAIRIVAETDDFVIVDKPPFMEAHPSKPTGKFTLWHGLRELLAFELANGGQVSLINRLDRETSGLTLVAKHRDAARTLHREMEAHRIRKAYLAIVWGWPVEETFAVDAPILRAGSRQPSRVYLKQMVHPEGATARTGFEVCARLARAGSNERFAIVRACPETGRMHQIRVHLAHHGFPIVGDKLYGPDEECYLEFIDTGWTPALAARLLLPRHALHSTLLRRETTGESWDSPLPADLGDWLRENLLVPVEGRSL